MWLGVVLGGGGIKCSLTVLCWGYHTPGGTPDLCILCGCIKTGRLQGQAHMTHWYEWNFLISGCTRCDALVKSCPNKVIVKTSSIYYQHKCCLLQMALLSHRHLPRLPLGARPHNLVSLYPVTALWRVKLSTLSDSLSSFCHFRIFGISPPIIGTILVSFIFLGRERKLLPLWKFNYQSINLSILGCSMNSYCKNSCSQQYYNSVFLNKQQRGSGMCAHKY